MGPDGTLVLEVGPVGDLPPGTARVVEGNGRRVAVFNVAGELVAFDARCLHRGGPLENGHVDRGIVTCPWHWWRYDLRTGTRIGAPDVALRSYAVTVGGGVVRVALPPTPPAEPIRERLLRLAREERQRTDGETPP